MNFSYDQNRIDQYDRNLDGKTWKTLEFEEQARARQLMRAGLGFIDGQDSNRKFRLKK